MIATVEPAVPELLTAAQAIEQWPRILALVQWLIICRLLPPMTAEQQAVVVTLITECCPWCSEEER